MKGLDSLIRIHKYQVEERQRDLAQLETRRRALQAELATLDHNLQAEMENARGLENGGAAYAAYAEAARQRRADITCALSEQDAEIAAAQALLKQAFEALKKYEIVEENLLASRKREAARGDQARLDEIATLRAANSA